MQKTQEVACGRKGTEPGPVSVVRPPRKDPRDGLSAFKAPQSDPDLTPGLGFHRRNVCSAHPKGGRENRIN